MSGEPATSVALPPGDPVYGSPTAIELLGAVEGFLRDGFADAERALAFEARVAANVVATVRRQLEAGDEPYRRVEEALASVGAPGEADLAAGLRSGRIDHRSPELRDALEVIVRTRLAVSNPRYLGSANPSPRADHTPKEGTT